MKGVRGTVKPSVLGELFTSFTPYSRTLNREKNIYIYQVTIVELAEAKGYS